MKIRQVVITGKNEVALQNCELDTSNLGPDELIIESEWTAISAGTELANYTALEDTVYTPGSWCEYPWPSGYANVGFVHATGSNVTRVDVGDRVFSYGKHADAFRYNQNRLLIKVPETIPSDIAALSRMTAVAATAPIISDIKPGVWVAVYGLGMVGNFASQLFTIFGCRVIGVDPVAERCDLATRCGIHAVVNAKAEQAHDAVMDITGGQGAAITVDAVGDSSVIRAAVGMTAPLGQHVLLGTPRGPVQGNLTDILKPVHLNYITMRGGLEWCLPMYPAGDGGVSQFSKQEMIFGYIFRGKLEMEAPLSHRLQPEDIKQAYEGLLRKKDEYSAVALEW